MELASGATVERSGHRSAASRFTVQELRNICMEARSSKPVASSTSAM
jgi:hypothetical protein